MIVFLLDVRGESVLRIFGFLEGVVARFLQGFQLVAAHSDQLVVSLFAELLILLGVGVLVLVQLHAIPSKKTRRLARI